MKTSALLLYRNGKAGAEFLLAGFRKNQDGNEAVSDWLIPGYNQVVGEQTVPGLSDVQNIPTGAKTNQPFIRLTPVIASASEKELKCVAIATKDYSIFSKIKRSSLILQDKNIVAGWFGLNEAYRHISRSHAPFLDELVGILSRKAFLAEIMVY